MAKLSKQQMITRLIDLYGSDAEMREVLIDDTKRELQRINDLMGLGALDWDFMRLPDRLRTTDPQIYYERVMGYYYEYMSYERLSKHYKENFKSRVVV